MTHAVDRVVLDETRAHRLNQCRDVIDVIATGLDHASAQNDMVISRLASALYLVGDIMEEALQEQPTLLKVLAELDKDNSLVN